MKPLRNSAIDTSDVIALILFAGYLCINFILIGAYSATQNLTCLQAVLFTAAVMSAPLQLVILTQLDTASISLTQITLLAILVNSRYVLFSFSLQASLQRFPWQHTILPIMLMGNTAYTLMLKKQQAQTLSPCFIAVTAFTLYLAALIGTAAGFILAEQSNIQLTPILQTGLLFFVTYQLIKQIDSSSKFIIMLLSLLCLSITTSLSSLYGLTILLTLAFIGSYYYAK